MDAARLEPDNSPDAPSTEGLTQELARELAAVAAAAGCELTRAEFKGGQLRLFVDKPEGVTIDDCQRVSKQASAILDVLDFGSGKYVLEVSSPGLDRPLYRPRDYARFVGSLARVRWQEAGVSHPRTDVGRIEAFDETDAGTITLRNETGKSVLSIRLDQIESARLEPEF